MKPTPPGWPRISSAVWYDEPKAAIEWLSRAFGFEVRVLVEDEHGVVQHSELTFGEGLIMVTGGSQEKFPLGKAPPTAGGANTQALMVYVDDVDAHFERAKAAGAIITRDLKTTDYGPEYWADRTYQCRDIGGHHWWFSQRIHTSGSTT